MSDVENFLEHHGIKGMKWGVRKKPEPKRSNDAKRRDYALQKRTVKPKVNKPLLKSPSRTLSNNELDALSKRLDKEIKLNNQIKELTKPAPKQNRVKNGHAFAKELMAATATAAGTAVSVYAWYNSDAGKAMMSKAAEYMAKRGADMASTASNQLTLF